MTLITKFDPFRDLNQLQTNLNRVFPGFFAENANRLGNELTTTGNFIPAVDVLEDEHNFTLKVEVPGIEQKDLDIEVENYTLTVSGERKFEKEVKEENFHRIERRYGSFYRAFTLPTTVDAEHVNANYNAGILKLELSKKPEAQPKQIKVNVGGQAKLDPHKEEPELVGAR
jgi:HSP20 family protein